VIALLQRVSAASVTVEGEMVGRIGRGLLVFVGVAIGDGPADIEYIASKVCDVRIFGDDRGRMARSVRDVEGALLVISQFTLLGDVRKGRRPAFDAAETPDAALGVYEDLVRRLRATTVPVETGRFQAHMQVELVNDGPVTLVIDSRKGRAM
jgi:D-tyrosyl-tRNA(Tyr) deacylase